MHRGVFHGNPNTDMQRHQIVGLRAVTALVLAAGAPAGAQEAQPPGFVDAATVVPDLVVEMRYFGSNNFIGRPVDGYEKPICLLTRQAAAALADCSARSRAARARAESVRLLSADPGGPAFPALGG